MLGEQNFFATELPNSTYREVDGDEHLYSKSAVKNPVIRIRQVKNQMRQVSELYKQSLTSYMKTKNGVDKTVQQTNKLRNQFLKLYSNRKIKLLNKSMLEQSNQLCEQYRLDRSNRARSLKLTNQLNLAYTRNQIESTNRKIKQQNRKQQQVFRKTLRLKKSQEYQENRNKFSKLKEQRNFMSNRRENLAAVQATKTRHNYLVKINKELQMLQDYTGLLDKVNSLNTTMNGQLFNSPLNQLDYMNKTFFVTTHNSSNN